MLVERDFCEAPIIKVRKRTSMLQMQTQVISVEKFGNYEFEIKPQRIKYLCNQLICIYCTN